MDFPRKAEFITGKRGGLVLLIDNQRYYRREVRGNRTFWTCSNRKMGCNGRAYTQDDLLKTVLGTHTCNKTGMNVDIANKNIAQEINEVPQDLNLDSTEREDDKILINATNGKQRSVMSMDNQRYFCSTRRGDTVYWGCSENGCEARVITKNGTLESTLGAHVCCLSPEKSQEQADIRTDVTGSTENSESHLPSSTGNKGLSISDSVSLKLASAEFRTNRIGKWTLYVDNIRYTCTNRAKEYGRNYWKCRHNNCRARAVTMGDCLVGVSGVHACQTPENVTQTPNENESIEETFVSFETDRDCFNNKIYSNANEETDTTQEHHSPEKSEETFFDPVEFKTSITPMTLEFNQDNNEINNQEFANKPIQELIVSDTIEKKPISAEFRINTNGQYVLYVDNVRYCRNGRKNKGRMYWSCGRNKCRARAVTHGNKLMSLSSVHICKSKNVTQRSEETDNKSVGLEGEKERLDAGCNEENHNKKFVQEPTSESVSFVKRDRRTTLLTIGSQKYKRTNHLPDIDRTYWICIQPHCPARVITVRKRVKYAYGTHTCSEPKVLGTTQKPEVKSEKEEQFANERYSFTTGKRGKKRLVIDEKMYKLAKSIPAIDKVYWICIRSDCPARATTLGGHLKSMTGSHVCDSDEYLNYNPDIKPEEAVVKFTTGKRGNKILVLNNRRYRRRNTLASSDRTYWECVRACAGGCRAKAITQAGHLVSSCEVHICGVRLETEDKQNEIIELPGMKRERCTETPHNADAGKPPAKKRKILRQKNIFEAFSVQIKANSLKEIEKTETIPEIIAEIPSQSSGQKEQEPAAKKAQKVNPLKRKIQQKRVKQVNNTATRRVVIKQSQKRVKNKALQQTSYTNLQEVKRMAHLQPRVMVARFLSTTIEKLSERMKVAYKLSAEADRMLFVNTLSIANLSLND